MNTKKLIMWLLILVLPVLIFASFLYLLIWQNFSASYLYLLLLLFWVLFTIFQVVLLKSKKALKKFVAIKYSFTLLIMSLYSFPIVFTNLFINFDSAAIFLGLIILLAVTTIYIIPAFIFEYVLALTPNDVDSDNDDNEVDV